jgi:hypothetical protein
MKIAATSWPYLLGSDLAVFVHVVVQTSTSTIHDTGGG